MTSDKPSRRALFLAVLACLGLSAALAISCNTVATVPVTPTPTRTPRPTRTPTPTPTPTVTPTPAWPVTVFISRGLPSPLADVLHATLQAHPDLFVPAPSTEEADVRVALEPAAAHSADAVPLAEWVYALVAPFPTLTDGVTWADVVGDWKGSATGPFAGQPLLMSTETAATLAVVMGEPVAGAVELVPQEEIVQRAWDARPTWAIVPFDQLEPRWKVLRIDGMSVLDKGLDTATYPLAVRVGVTGLERGVAEFEEMLPDRLTNRDAEKMSVVLLTGVTALARATGIRMDRYGATYPAQDIQPPALAG